MKTKDIAQIAIFIAVLTICSWINIPMAVPFTLQTFGVFLTCLLLGGKKGTITVSLFVLLGTIGLPVFGGFTGGLGIVLGTTGGYIIGFIFTALIMWLFERFLPSSPTFKILSMLVGLLVCYLIGTIWFMVVYASSTGEIGLITTLTWCVFPFIIPDLLKIALAYLLSIRLKKVVK